MDFIRAATCPPTSPMISNLGWAISIIAMSANMPLVRNTSAGWQERRDATNDPLPVTRVWTDFLPQQEVERVVPARSDGVEFGMEALARAAVSGAEAVSAALDSLPELYAEWRRGQEGMMTGLAPRRLKTGQALLENVDTAGSRIRDGIDLLKRDTVAREAFGLMNTAMAMANRRREAVIQKKLPGDVDPPTWRPFQLAFVLLNLVGVTDRNSGEREIVDLLFFRPAAARAYLGLAAYAIVLRRLRGSGVLGAGISVIMRYTLRLLTPLVSSARSNSCGPMMTMAGRRLANGRSRLDSGWAAQPHRTIQPRNS
ncbi:hypothetical protein [Mesorhizobium sp.]|nr:hypothetical protein [Mesorhizobium sp.]TIN20846.1 MAG: hypothetical protein E5Y51_01235 [Mesorhizobium sp.]